MRTTLNLDGDVETRLKELARLRGRPLSRIANDLIRAGLRASDHPGEPDPYEPPTFDTGPPLLDVRDIAQAIETIADGG
ncbi:MAG: hypothetical protein ACRD0Q_02985 [Acidimicrobiales bacterium]